MTETLKAYIELRAKMDEFFDEEFFGNVFKHHEKYENIRKEIQEKCNPKEVFYFELKQHEAQGHSIQECKHIAKARVLNLFGEDTEIQ